MGRLADFVDNIEQKRERRMKQRLEPFYQGMEQILLKKEDTERKTKHHNWLKTQFTDDGIDIPESTAEMNFDDIENNQYLEEVLNEKRAVKKDVDFYTNMGFSKDSEDEKDQDFLDRVKKKYGTITNTETVKVLKDGEAVNLRHNKATDEWFDGVDKVEISDYTGVQQEGKTRKFKKDGFEITEEFSETTGWTELARSKIAGGGTDADKLKKDYEGKLVELGLYNEFNEKFPDADGEKLKELYTRAKAVAESNRKSGNKTIKIAGIERIKTALEEVGDTTTEILESNLAEKEKELSEMSGLKKTFYPNDTKKLKKEIETLKYDIEDRKILDDLFEGMEEKEIDKGDEGGEVVEITTQEEYDALPAGTIYLENGVEFRKPE